MVQRVQTLAHVRRVVCEKKDRPGKKDRNSKAPPESIKIYRELEIHPPTNAKSVLVM